MMDDVATGGLYAPTVETPLDPVPTLSSAPVVENRQTLLSGVTVSSSMQQLDKTAAQPMHVLNIESLAAEVQGQTVTDKLAFLINEVLKLRKAVKQKTEEYLAQEKQLIKRHEDTIKLLMSDAQMKSLDIPPLGVTLRLDERTMGPGITMQDLKQTLTDHYGPLGRMSEVEEIVEKVGIRKCLAHSAKMDSLKMQKRYHQTSRLSFEVMNRDRTGNSNIPKRFLRTRKNGHAPMSYGLNVLAEKVTAIRKYLAGKGK
jgi:hypothetical protein